MPNADTSFGNTNLSTPKVCLVYKYLFSGGDTYFKGLRHCLNLYIIIQKTRNSSYSHIYKNMQAHTLRGQVKLLSRYSYSEDDRNNTATARSPLLDGASEGRLCVLCTRK